MGLFLGLSESNVYNGILGRIKQYSKLDIIISKINTWIFFIVRKSWHLKHRNGKGLRNKKYWETWSPNLWLHYPPPRKVVGPLIKWYSENPTQSKVISLEAVQSGWQKKEMSIDSWGWTEKKDSWKSKEEIQKNKRAKNNLIYR